MEASAQARIPIIDYLRGLASLVVAWFHLTNTYSATSPVTRSGSLGWLGVDCFFVISGFVLPYLLSGVPGGYRLACFPRFMARRALRLEPAYLVSIAMVIVLWYLSAMMPGFAGQAPAIGVGDVIANALYIVPLTAREWLQPVYWTLAYELVFYIAIGLLFPVVAGRRSQLGFLALCVVILGLVMARAMPGQWILFIMGMLVHKRVSEGLGWAWTGASLVACILVMYSRGNANPAYVGAFTALAILFGRGLTIGGLAGRLLSWLGLVSYSLYLVHVPIGGRVVNLGRRFIGDSAGAELALSLTALAVSLAAAAVFFWLVERPSHRMSRRIAMGPASASVAQSVP